MAKNGAVVSIYQTLLDRQKKKCEDSYAYFFRCAWRVLEPGTELVWNWHYDYLCGVLEAEVRRIVSGKPKTKDLIINICPRSGKSYLVAILLNAWVWTQWPGMRFITASYGQPLAIFHATETRRLLQSPWYQERWGHVWSFEGDQNAKSFFQTDKRGHRLAVQTGTGTGFGADIIVFDDPINAEQADSDVYRERAIRWITKTMHTRLNRQEVGLRILIMQRLHENDPTGYILANHADDWRWICIPAEESDKVSPAALHKNYQNGLFWIERFSEAVLLSQRRNLRAYGYSGQYQQDPSPDEGGIFKRQWFRYWVPRGMMSLPPVHVKTADGNVVSCVQIELPEIFDETIQSWDMAFKDFDESSLVAGHIWSRIGSNMFMMDRKADHMDFVKSAKAVEDMHDAHPEAAAILVENKANGPAIISYLHDRIPGIIPVEATSSKTDRANKIEVGGAMPLSAKIEAGNVYMPHPAIAPWSSDVVDQFAKFPKAAINDDVDAASQASNYFSRAKHVFPYFSMASLKKVNIRWDNTQITGGSLHYGAVVQALDARIFCMGALWDAVRGILIVYDAWHLDPVPALVASTLERRLHLRRYRIDRLLGNSMLSKAKPPARSAASMINRELKALRITFRIKESLRYDSYGAITYANELFARSRFIIDKSRADDAAREMATWAIDVKNNKPDDENCGYSTCLLHIVSELDRHAELRKVIRLTDYRSDTTAGRRHA